MVEQLVDFMRYDLNALCMHLGGHRLQFGADRRLVGLGCNGTDSTSMVRLMLLVTVSLTHRMDSARDEQRAKKGQGHSSQEKLPSASVWELCMCSCISGWHFSGCCPEYRGKRQGMRADDGNTAA